MSGECIMIHQWSFIAGFFLSVVSFIISKREWEKVRVDEENPLILIFSTIFVAVFFVFGIVGILPYLPCVKVVI